MKRKRTAMSYNETLAKDMYGRRPAHLSSIQRLNAVGAVYGPESADHGRNCSSVIEPSIDGPSGIFTNGRLTRC
ncbi:MAG: hypothetical protein OJF51_003706 [Nitrospira sp.]|jgi:hypothetical protein|nr:MAG: hypothetical protein OJF51_003706 [Nitrospira sp.]